MAISTQRVKFSVRTSECTSSLASGCYRQWLWSPLARGKLCGVEGQTEPRDKTYVAIASSNAKMVVQIRAKRNVDMRSCGWDQMTEIGTSKDEYTLQKLWHSIESSCPTTSTQPAVFRSRNMTNDIHIFLYPYRSVYAANARSRNNGKPSPMKFQRTA